MKLSLKLFLISVLLVIIVLNGCKPTEKKELTDDDLFASDVLTGGPVARTGSGATSGTCPAGCQCATVTSCASLSSTSLQVTSKGKTAVKVDGVSCTKDKLAYYNYECTDGTHLQRCAVACPSGTTCVEGQGCGGAAPAPAPSQPLCLSQCFPGMCGTVYNNCGSGTNLVCGDCASGFTCVNYQCVASGTCTPSKTCADYPGQCGSLSDGCTNSLNCGCPSDQICNSAGTCEEKSPPTGPVCGQNGCEAGEMCSNCPTDCGVCKQCNDQIDNDGDTKTDYPADLGCLSLTDDDEVNCGDGVCSPGEDGVCSSDCASGPGEITDCNDGIDNDGDGKKDYSTDPNLKDPGCISTSDTSELGTVACDDGADSTVDKDSKKDYRPNNNNDHDTGCSSLTDNDEIDGKCDDTFDNDYDGTVDYWFGGSNSDSDSGCSSAGDNDECSDWSYPSEGAGEDKGMDITTGSNGDIYVTGYKTFTGQGKNFWTQKFNPHTSQPQWGAGKQWDGAAHADDVGYDLVWHNSGSARVFVAGSTTTSANGRDVQIVSYFTSDGALSEIHSWDGAAHLNDEAKGIALDPNRGTNGNYAYYITGWSVRLQSDGVENTDALLQKWVPGSSTPAWTKTSSSINPDWGEAIAMDGAGYIYTIGGDYRGDVVTPSYDILIRRYSGTGGLLKEIRLGQDGYDSGQGIVIDSAKNSLNGYTTYIVGTFTNTNSPILGKDIMVKKIDWDVNGVPSEVWTKMYDGGNKHEEGYDIVLRGDFVYVTGLQQEKDGTLTKGITIKLNKATGEVLSTIVDDHSAFEDSGRGITNYNGDVFINGYDQTDSTNYRIWTQKYCSSSFT